LNAVGEAAVQVPQSTIMMSTVPVVAIVLALILLRPHTEQEL
jgi:hypothetical protein